MILRHSQYSKNGFVFLLNVNNFNSSSCFTNYQLEHSLILREALHTEVPFYMQINIFVSMRVKF